MIPYEELVYALQNWRAKQGLPVTVTAAPGSGPQRAAPPPPPPPGSSGSGGFSAYAPPIEETMEDVDDALVEEAHYDPDGGDFAMALGGGAPDDGESTSIGGIPSEDGAPIATDSGQHRSGSGRTEDW